MRQRRQRRGLSIAMSSEEMNDFLAAERTCRVATVDRRGHPHVTPLWFVWTEGALWLNSLVRSQRWTDVDAHPEIAAVVDAGGSYGLLRGVEIRGMASVVGDVPRGIEPDERLEEVEKLFAQKYRPGGPFAPDGLHGWLRLDPASTVSWDFRKVAGRAGRDRSA